MKNKIYNIQTKDDNILKDKVVYNCVCSKLNFFKNIKLLTQKCQEQINNVFKFIIIISFLKRGGCVFVNNIVNPT